MNKEQFYVGIDVGSVSVNCVVIDKNEEIIYEAPYRRHFGRIEDVVSELVEEIYKRFGKGSIRAISFTGNHGRKLSKKLNTHYEFDTISQVLGALKVVPDVRTIISMGGQDTELFQINHTDSGWELEYFNTNGPCASGTGSFIDQQAQRLATSIYSEDVHISQEEIDKVLKDFIELGLKSDRPASVACRCTVFTKSDMIHLQNRGEKLEDIIYGLHVGNARNYISTIVGTRTLKEPIIFIGGLSLNKLQVKAFKEYFPNLIIPPFSTSIGAIGVALQVLRQDRTKEEQKSNIFDFDLDKLDSLKKEQMELIPTAPKLRLRLTHFPEADEIKFAPISNGEKVYLGIDIGSTSTKYALINTNKEIVHKCYVPTQGRPIEVTQHLLKVIKEEVGDKIEIAGVATTGSGRNVVGDFLNADLIIDEITAHARGAVEIDPEVDTIFEIGGQDSKYIYIQNRHPLDFDMNKVCAAGTGSFLHELANKYGINIVGEFQEIALSSDAPVRLTERCTVFMESDLVSYHQRGVDIKDLMAGLCYAIVYNYLNRVVGRRKIGKRIMFLGGPSLNKAVVAAFENVLGREILVPPHREVLGAYGAAISVLEKMEQEGKRKSDFRGLDSAINDRMEYVEKICTADPNCSNQCKLKIYNFGGRKSIWGGDCGRYETSRTRWKRTENYFAFRQKIWDSYIKKVCIVLDKDEPLLDWNGKPTVGMQRALYMHHVGIFWAYFFHFLGFQPVITPPTNPRISKIGIESIVTETCYPVKISHGHVKELIGKTRYIFLPTMINMTTPSSSEVGFYCPMVQSNSYMLRSALRIKKDHLLDPIVHMKYDNSTLSVELHEQLSKKLKINRKKILNAIEYGREKQEEFQRELYKKGEEIINQISSDEHLLIVTGRPYNLYDERLNLRLGQNLSKIGFNAIPLDFIDLSSVDLSDFPSMYWGLGSRILRAARLVSMTPNYFGLHLTNFSCGADSFIEHFYKYIMGDKPYLILELDEHSAVAGVMTRLEAFRNVIDNAMQEIKQKKKGLGLKAA